MRGILIIILTCILGTLSSCVQPLDEQQIIDTRLSKRLADYKKDKLFECKEEAIDAAEYHVDSLIDTWVGREVMDTLSFPKQPLKPSKPDGIIGTVKKFTPH